MVAQSCLQFVDLLTADGQPTPGLALVRDRGAQPPSLKIDEQVAVYDAESFKHIDYVFFRRFSDGRSSQVAAYVVDNSDERLNEQALSRLHLQVWLHGTAPLLYVAWPSRIDVLTCARGPDFWKHGECRYEPAKALRTAGAISSELPKFSAFRLADGTFWEDPGNAQLADYAKAAHQSLIQAVVEADSDLGGKNNPIVRRLLLLMVLIKYLEDRHVFPDNGWFGRFHRGARSFFEVLQKAEPDEVYRLSDFLEHKFNGDVFRLPREGRQELTKTTLARFADLVEARTLNRQRYLWEQFSFEHLPVEIISHLYQRFVEGGHGTVYTPPFLASLLLDHAMPYDKLTGEERVLDPACGSGVFLVGAFRRLINAWRKHHDWKRPGVDSLKRILKGSIFGIELDPLAVELSSFSLSLALCDALQPEVIWRDLELDPLRGSNLLKADFFQVVLNSRKDKHTVLDSGFDVVIGNPPFESKLTSAGKEVDRSANKKDRDRGALPDKQAAYLFLEQAFTYLRPGGRVCLIQPSGFLFNRKADRFRNSIFGKRRVETILDFTSIRKLYESDPKTVAIVASVTEPPEGHRISHWTFRRTTSVHERICFELDHYDRYRVSQEQAETDPFVWRADLLGGGRLLSMSQRLRNMRTLAEYADQDGWDYGEGFIAGKTGKRIPALFLTGKPYLPTCAFTQAGIDESQIDIVKEKLFKSPYTERRYSPPLVLIKETDTLPLALWDKGFLAYRDKVVGIHAPRHDSQRLHEFYEFLRAKQHIYRFCCTLNGSQSLVGKATAILKQDIDALPYPEDLRDLSFSFWEEAIRQDVVRYMSEYVRLGQNSQLLKMAAGPGDLRDYASMFVRMLGTVYANLRAAEPVFLNGLTCQVFYFGECPDLIWLDEDAENELKRLVYHQNHEHLRTVRVFRYYEENVMLIVKPDRLRYWIRSTAIRDADETLLDLRQQGY